MSAAAARLTTGLSWSWHASKGDARWEKWSLQCWVSYASCDRIAASQRTLGLGIAKLEILSGGNRNISEFLMFWSIFPFLRKISSEKLEKLAANFFNTFF